ncbi:MAG: glycosyltransferase, partial [Ardenticatenales bacterium]|nr:glycosyltransferase [Ardenticatenales bacterium]
MARIALVVPGGVDRSGRERVIPVLLWLIERLARRHELSVFALHQYEEPCVYSLLGATVYNLGSVPRGALPGLALWRRGRLLVRALRAAGPFDVLHAFWGDTTGWLTVMAGRWLDVPVLVSLGGGELVALPEIGYGSQLHARARLQVAQVGQLAVRMTAATPAMCRQAEARGFPVLEVPLGVDKRCFAPPLARPGPPWRLLHVASLNPVKDQATLLRALRRVIDAEPAVHLDIIGEDTLNGQIQAQAVALGLDHHITFHGFLPNDEIRAFYQRSHLFVLTSRHEAGPVAVLEAAACAVPTVGTA